MARKGLRFTMGPYTFRQRWVPESVLEKTECYADVNFDTRLLRLADVCDHERAIENLMHELVEAANEIGDLELGHEKIQVLGLLLAQALKPLIRRWW